MEDALTALERVKKHKGYKMIERKIARIVEVP
jgi:hypothetical protein